MTERNRVIDHPAKAAEDIFERFTNLMAKSREVIDQNRRLRTSCEEVSGLLDGMMQRRIASGTSRLSDALREIIEVWPDEPDDELFHIIGDCANFGLSLDGMSLAPYSGRNLPRGFTK